MDAFDFVNRANADYVDQQYQQYLQDPRNVDAYWQAFFAGFDIGTGKLTGVTPGGSKVGDGSAAHIAAAVNSVAEVLQIEIADLVHSYRELGHYVATLDPLGHHRPAHPLLDLSEFGLSMADLDRQVGQGGFLHPTDGTLRDLLDKLRTTYCQDIEVEFLNISDKTQREWLLARMEPSLNHPPHSADESKDLLRQLVKAQGFEEYLGVKYPSAKRFSAEGGETLIPLINAIVEDGATLGAEEMVIGMAHRGRLNVLVNVLEKPYEVMLAEFEGTAYHPQEEGDGDVKYHMGYSKDRITKSGKRVHLALSFNPSHLEIVNPVVEGIVRAKQYYLGDLERSRVVPILIHGDAAFVGQGIVQETLSLSEMPYWRTGGTVHIIVNNQIGFTTMPKQGRFTPYPSDVAKMIQAPVFHVNGDDPEAVVHVAKLAIAFRQKFHQDVIIDLWCYRRHGHNEADEPSFTQPLMYKEIDAHARVRELYAQKLIDQGKLTPDEFEAMKAEFRAKLDEAKAAAQEVRPRERISSLGGMWTGFAKHGEPNVKTNVSAELIRRVGTGATSHPADFNPHPKLKRLLLSRKEMSEGKLGIDWGTAEMFALGSLVLEGTPVRFVGQDVQRGTFSHRHACLHDYENGKKWYPLANLAPDQAPIIFVNTMLSELAVLGFEYGFSSADPRNLVIWEAQFGDFVNGAQAVIDQFIAAGESKWQKMCGLVILLPHGYEGQGPEHSNAYLERWLQLCAEDNMQVIYPSLPSQYFHALRRQMKRNFRKPLIAMMPKSLLRSEASSSSLDEFVNGQFQLVIDDPANPPRDKVKRLLMCSGKVYFLLNNERVKQKIEDVAIVRVEQLYPFPQKEVQAVLAKYGRAEEVCWVQEEPRNRGAWDFMRDRLTGMLADHMVLTYCGRDEAASPATGSYKAHGLEEKEIIAQALELPSVDKDKDTGVAKVAVTGGVKEPQPTAK